MKNAVAKFEAVALPTEPRAKQIVMIGLAVLAVSVSMYVYFVGKIVFDVVGRRAAESSIKKEISAVSSLESAYLKEMQNLDLADAGRLGLTEAKGALYASRTPATTASLVGTGL